MDKLKKNIIILIVSMIILIIIIILGILLLNKKQEEGLMTVIDRYRRGEKFTVIGGYAGTGKSTLVKFIVSALAAEGVIPDKDVVYNENLDRYDNIDIMICGKHNWGIHLFTNTKRANNFRKKKDGRHEDVFSNVREIDLVLDLSRERKSYGNVFLYDEIDFQHLLELCKNYKI